MTTAAQLMVKVGADVSQAISGLRQVNDSIGGLATSAGQKLQAVGGHMMGVGAKATAMALPVAGAMTVAIKAAADFESQMNILDITMRESGVTGEQWSQVALKIGADSELVGISASEAADAITNFGKAGLDTTQILGDMSGYLEGNTSLTGALRAAIDLAAASSMELDAASQGVVQTMNQYGLGFDQASRVMDNFVRTADASTASVEQLLDAQANVGPVMAQMGFSVEQANVQLAMLHDRGIMGAEAGTALKSMWLHMVNPATKAADALADLNVSLYDASGNMRSAKDIVGDLSKALDEQATVMYQSGGATAAQAKELVSYERKIAAARLAIEEYTAGARGANLTDAKRAEKIAELNAKIELYTQKHSELAGAIPGVTSELMKMTDAQRNSYLQMIAGSYGIKALNILVDEGSIGWDEYEKAISGATSMQEQAAARTQGFEAAMEQFKSVLETFMITAATPFIRDFLTPFLRKAAEVIQKVMEVHPGFAKWAMAIGAVIVVAGPILMFIGSLISAIGTIISVVGGAISIFGGLVGAIGSAVAAIAAAGAPVLLVIGAIIAIVILLKKAWDENFLGIRDAIQEFWSQVERAFGYVKTIIQNFFRFLSGEITWEEFLTRARIALERIGTIMSDAFNTLGQRLAEIWERLKALIVEKLAEFIAPLVGGMDRAREIVTTAFQRIGEFLAAHWENLKTMAAGAWEFIKGIIDGAVEFIRGVIAVAMQIISGDWEGAWNTIKETVTRVWDGIKTGISNAMEVIGPKIKTAWEDIKTAVIEKVETLKTAVAEKWEAIKTAVSEKVEAIKAAVSEKVEAIKAAAVEKWEGIKQGVTEKVETLKTAVAEKWETMKAGAVEKWEAVKERISSIVTTIKDFVVNTIGGLVEKAIELFGKLIGALTGGGEGGGATGNPFTIDFSVLIAALMSLRESWTLTQTHITTTLAQIKTQVQADFAVMQQAIAATNLAIQENTMTVWLALQTWLITIWQMILTALMLHNQSVLETTRQTLTAIQTETVNTWTMLTEYLLLTWETLRSDYNEKQLAMLAVTRQGLQWIFQEHERTWPLIVAKVVDAMAQMLSKTTDAMGQIASVVRGTLEGLVGAAHASGQALGNAFADGIRASIGAIAAAAAAAAAAARAYLPGSDAERGPLSDLTASGRALPKTFAAGMRAGVRDITNAANYLSAQAKPHVIKPRDIVDAYMPPKMPPKIKPPMPASSLMTQQGAHPTRPREIIHPIRPREIMDALRPIADALKPAPPQYATRPAVPALTPQYATRPAEPANTLSTSGQLAQANKPAQCITINIYNPTGKPSEESIMAALKRLAAVGLLEPV